MTSLPTLTIEDAKLVFRNFKGEARAPYNAAGDRNFGVIIDTETAKQLRADGWNVRKLKAADDEVPPEEAINVKINIKSGFPPRLYLINQGRQPTLLSVDEYNILDFARFERVDLTINPYVWQEEPQRVTGYLAEGYFTLAPDKLRDRYWINTDEHESA